MADTRRKDVDWQVADVKTGAVFNWEAAILATLMDVRDEMKKLNAVFSCSRFQGIPNTLDRIAKHTRRKKKRQLRVVRRRTA